MGRLLAAAAERVPVEIPRARSRVSRSVGGRDMRGVVIQSEYLLLLLAAVLSLAWGVMVVL